MATQIHTLVQLALKADNVEQQLVFLSSIDPIININNAILKDTIADLLTFSAADKHEQVRIWFLRLIPKAFYSASNDAARTITYFALIVTTLVLERLLKLLNELIVSPSSDWQILKEAILSSAAISTHLVAAM